MQNLLEKLNEQVEAVLQDYHETRNSDIALTIRIWQKFYGVEESIRTDDLFSLPSQDNIKRVRAKIQNEEKRLLPTDWAVAKRRGWLEQEWKKALGYYVERDQLLLIGV